MPYSQIQELEEYKFLRFTGVKRRAFKKMTSIFTNTAMGKKAKGGRKNKLCAKISF